MIRLALAALALTPAGAARADEPVGGPWTAEGSAKTDFDAEQYALEDAARVVGTYLTQSAPDVEWRPDVAFLRGSGIVQLPGEVRELNLPKSGRAFEVRLRVCVLPEHLRKIREADATHRAEREKADRLERVERRQRGAAVGLAAVVLGMLVVAGYLRLEEATRGYSTGLLRAAAVVALVLLGAGAWALL
jgi:hypothetical protein